ncbi:MAG: endolytic transglycosylase MltG [candidate division Zixibacteria bacterium]|nr:endolytic transglycosylase MltG [candidate division Zixibacteria bacterium]
MTRKILLTLILITAIAIAFGWYYLAVAPAGSIEGDKDVIIIANKGETLISIAQRLQEQSIIDNSKILVGLVSVIGSPNEVKAGRYDFSKDNSYLTIARLLLKGSNSPVRVTFPEGLTYKQMAGIVYRRLSVDSTAFVRACENDSLLKQFNIDADNFEGYLFPDTYYIYFGSEPEKIVGIMVERFFEVFDGEMVKRAEAVGFNIHEAVTMASLIEKETGLKDERRTISAVFHNRLRKGMKLQCDPTVIYALPNLNRPLWIKDLAVDSPYNTYRYYGLPPGPIANPGQRSLEAAVNPADVDYLYFVASGDGGHLFAETNRQHNNNRIKVKRQMREKR